MFVVQAGIFLWSVSSNNFHSSIAPATLMHKAMQTVEIEGFSIPEGSLLIGNFLSTHMDPEFWDEPEKFKPERFLDDEGKILKETQNFFPLSVGKRVCLGESLARVELFIFFTALVRDLEFRPTPTRPPPSTQNYKIGITRIPDGFYCSVSERK